MNYVSRKMSATDGCSCVKCEKSCHVVLKTDRAHSITRLKLMEQAHCAYCWEPLKVSSEWPCTRSAWRIATKFKDLSVNHCGHVFHALCINKKVWSLTPLILFFIFLPKFYEIGSLLRSISKLRFVIL